MPAQGACRNWKAHQKDLWAIKLAKGGMGVIVGLFRKPFMPKSPYEGGKQRKHFTLSEAAHSHLSKIASAAMLSRSETLERLIRSVPIWEGCAAFSNTAWPSCIDFSQTTESSESLP